MDNDLLYTKIICYKKKASFIADKGIGLYKKVINR